MPRSGAMTAGCWTGVMKVLVLSPGVPSVGPTVAVLVPDEPLKPADSVATTVTAALPPGSRTPEEVQLTPGAVQTKPVPLALWKESSIASGSLTMNPDAGTVPVFVTVSVYTRSSPGLVDAGPV